MRIAITGASGLIGKAAATYFQARGHAVTRVSRQRGRLDLDPVSFQDQDAVIHLAGANIAAQRWSDRYKKLLYSSRVETTTQLCKVLTNMNTPPQILLCASAIGIYGHIEPPAYVDEGLIMGDGFLYKLCVDWEHSTHLAEEMGIRVVHMRFGIVLSPDGGALAKMLPVFKLGLGGRVGLGKQMMSWIALDEIPAAMEHVINTPDLSGAVNFVAPKAVSNAEFTRVLAKALRRPAFLPVPAPAIKVLFGEMGKELLLSGANVIPKRLSESGYVFRYPDLETALSQMFSR
ncbi:MAG TPA: TIGR01777 family protein [Candidatus Omnitrophica bacterium]|nr:MAG: TIGR01777 family protein [Omnitrophica WOR_2 bacterium GWA2_53_43]HBO97482.1 TIGR01777 family protein [Candidatus Omnitrophota bacterium]HCI44427.1 TIGR01777 family protein [Candidatus Omnitrophota bacterium]